ncbi:Six-hairpin glycosidase-like protein [Naematelia encephala]|uniref:Six-hairpin glycosidase-like protein n=1 Tax=Naematelia encephala TaxID=71784 RepID=A0A1Y2AD53_9TREE|nr:Six-hairpin glycosidase-like protein [Naematelia encephala]
MVNADKTRNFPASAQDKHYLVIIDNMMNLDMMYEATKLTGDPKYAKIATHQAEKSSDTHVRKDGTTYHVVNFDPKTGKALDFMTHQGYSDESAWSRGQAWGIYGYAQCALRTGRDDFRDTSRRLADVFLSLLPDSGVPEWDFRAPKPCPYDASAGTIAARGLQMLYQLLLPSDKSAAEEYLVRANKLVEDILRECGTPAATLDKDGKVNWGEGSWETLLQHSTINGNEKATRRLLDHGLVYADYYLMEFGNEAIKIERAKEA